MKIPENKRFVFVSFAILVVLTIGSIIVSIAINASGNRSTDDIIGCYVFEENIYTNPLSSFRPVDSLPFVYGFDENLFIIADTAGGPVQTFDIDYSEIRVGADEFEPAGDSAADPILRFPDISRFRERTLLATMSGEGNYSCKLYRMNGDLWLAEGNGNSIWSIYRLKKTDATALEDLHRVIAFYKTNQPVEIAPSPGAGIGLYENQMTLGDVYALARKGERLSLTDFALFPYWLVGNDFRDRLFEVVGADTVLVQEYQGKLESALLKSRRATDNSQTVDIRDGFEAVAGYLNPLSTFMDITIEYAPGLIQESELLFTDDYFGSDCNYYLSAGGVDNAFVTFNNTDERLLVKDALKERRITIEDAVAGGLFGVSMVPVDNPLGGEFPILVHSGYEFMLGDDMFYPSKSFMYAIYGISVSTYIDIGELIELLEWYGYKEKAESLRESVNPASIVNIAGKNYVLDITLAGAGVSLSTGWAISSHVPIQFSLK